MLSGCPRQVLPGLQGSDPMWSWNSWAGSSTSHPRSTCPDSPLTGTCLLRFPRTRLSKHVKTAFPAYRGASKIPQGTSLQARNPRFLRLKMSLGESTGSLFKWRKPGFPTYRHTLGNLQGVSKRGTCNSLPCRIEPFPDVGQRVMCFAQRSSSAVAKRILPQLICFIWQHQFLP